MKKFLLFIIFLLIICVVGAQFIVPKFLESQVESELNRVLQPTSQTVNIESTPAFKLVYGQADHVSGTLENVRLGKLNFTSLHYDINDIVVNPISLLTSKEVDVLHVDKAYAEGVVIEDDLKQFLVENTEGLQDADIHMSNQMIRISGTVNIWGSLRGQGSLEGSLELKNNVLLFAPTRFTMNGLTVSGLTSQLLKPIEIYNFNQFPVPVQAESVNVENGEVHIKIKPVLN